MLGVPVRFALALVLVLGLAACAGSGLELNVGDAPPGEAPPRDAHLGDAGWAETAAWLQREVAAGRPAIVNLWASWCAPCRAEAPLLRAAVAANPEVAWLGVAHLDLRADAERFLAEHRIGFPTVLDLGGDVAIAIQARGMPATAFFDHRGNLVHIHNGILTEPVLAQRVADLVAAARGD